MGGSSGGGGGGGSWNGPDPPWKFPKDQYYTNLKNNTHKNTKTDLYK